MSHSHSGSYQECRFAMSAYCNKNLDESTNDNHCKMAIPSTERWIRINGEKFEAASCSSSLTVFTQKEISFRFIWSINWRTTILLVPSAVHHNDSDEFALMGLLTICNIRLRKLRIHQHQILLTHITCKPLLITEIAQQRVFSRNYYTIRPWVWFVNNVKIFHNMLQSIKLRWWYNNLYTTSKLLLSIWLHGFLALFIKDHMAITTVTLIDMTQTWGPLK